MGDPLFICPLLSAANVGFVLRWWRRFPNLHHQAVILTQIIIFPWSEKNRNHNDVRWSFEPFLSWWFVTDLAGINKQCPTDSVWSENAYMGVLGGKQRILQFRLDDFLTDSISEATSTSTSLSTYKHYWKTVENSDFLLIRNHLSCISFAIACCKTTM